MPRRQVTVPFQGLEGHRPFTDAQAAELARAHGLQGSEGLSAQFNELAVTWKIADAAERYPDRKGVARELASLRTHLEKARAKLKHLSPGARWAIEEQLRRWNADELAIQDNALFYLLSATRTERPLERLPDIPPGHPPRSPAGDTLIRSLAEIYRDRSGASASIYRDEGEYVDKGVGAFVQALCKIITGEEPPLSQVEVALRGDDES